jgi:hypothetical protein
LRSGAREHNHPINSPWLAAVAHGKFLKKQVQVSKFTGCPLQRLAHASLSRPIPRVWRPLHLGPPAASSFEHDENQRRRVKTACSCCDVRQYDTTRFKRRHRASSTLSTSTLPVHTAYPTKKVINLFHPSASQTQLSFTLTASPPFRVLSSQTARMGVVSRSP